ncbi:hypothetical protein Taro_019702 [Colocasia esculenta]|uniref:Uncharacterized protein n=1 Tax=Colocasia esculenta TaxID=4460 RepID=A0A843V301_COLES|nr:hypothetical protein [Colocasia esculenta]
MSRPRTGRIERIGVNSIRHGCDPIRFVDPTRSATMAPKDIGWQHVIALGSRHNYKCNYCHYTGQGGGDSCLKKYLAGGRLAGYHDVQGCKSVPAEVKRLMVEHLKGVWA